MYYRDTVKTLLMNTGHCYTKAVLTSRWQTWAPRLCWWKGLEAVTQSFSIKNKTNCNISFYKTVINESEHLSSIVVKEIANFEPDTFLRFNLTGLVLYFPDRGMWMTKCQWKRLLKNICAWTSAGSWSPSQPVEMSSSLRNDNCFHDLDYGFISCTALVHFTYAAFDLDDGCYSEY